MGHALTATIEDILCPLAPHAGAAALWMPGTDHAGIATQVMVERELAKEGKTRQGIGREAFLERTWQWKGRPRRHHRRAARGLGCVARLDRATASRWTRSRRGRARGVLPLHEEGLIYRAYRLINWDHASQTALSDLEVEHKEVDGTPVAPGLPGRGRRGEAGGRDHAPGDDAGRHRRGGAPGRPALPAPDRQAT
jgi:valyl-tRNA synthetase